MKLLVYLVFTILLAGCNFEEMVNKADKKNEAKSEEDEICLKGVVYYKIYLVESHKAFVSIAPKVDTKTLTFIRCEE